MRRRFQVGGLALAVAVLAASMLVIGSADGSGTHTVRAKAAVSRSGAVAHMSVRASSVRRLVLSNEGTVQPGTFDGAVGKCPKKYPTPVSGWFSAKSDKVTLGESIPVGNHKWAVGVVSFDTAPSEYIVGVVCLK